MATELPTIIGGKYRPVRVIGRGGMGVVFEVVHANTGEHLALKVMTARSLHEPALVERFKREARVATSIKSEHVVRVTDADVAPELDGAPFLVMELLDGVDLERLCEARRPSPAEAVDWLRQVGRALDRAHRQGVVHRDLKPENLFLASREELPPIIKVLDFGVAKMADEGASQTASGQLLGTPRYMSPEQAGGHVKAIAAAADRFGLGLIAFRLLCGRHYFEAGSLAELLQSVARGPASAPSLLGSELGAAFDVWFARACHPDPARRFASCHDQVEALAEALGLPRQAPSPSGPVPLQPGVPERPGADPFAATVAPQPAQQRRGLLWAGVGGVGALAVVLLVRLARPSPSPALVEPSPIAQQLQPPAATADGGAGAGPGPRTGAPMLVPASARLPVRETSTATHHPPLTPATATNPAPRRAADPGPRP
jgi:serine/threonine-protein kinase